MVRTIAEDDNDRQLLSDIEQHGWHLVAINDDDEGPAYVFSVGLFHTLGQPEICLFGLSDVTVMGQIINLIGDLVRAGQQFEDWKSSVEVLDGYSCVFREVAPSLYQEYFGYCRWFYEGDAFPMLQCVWPDEDGRFPWDRQFNAELVHTQPVLATKSSWLFDVPKNAAVFTTCKVTEGNHPILFVSHDSDGDWQFLCGTTIDSEDCRVVCLSHLAQEHPTITELANLPSGWIAERENASSPWERYRRSD